MRRLVLGALLLLSLPAPASSQDGTETDEAARAEALLTRLYADHGNESILKEAVALREECLASGNHRTAEFLAGQVSNHRPDRLDERHRYQEILLARGKADMAERDLRDLIRDRPSDCRAYWMLSGVLLEAGRPAEAREVHAAHLKEHPGDAGALDAMADIALWSLHDPQAVTDAVAALRAAAAEPKVPPATSKWLRERADSWEKANLKELDWRKEVQSRSAVLDLLLGGAALLAIALGFGALRLTRQPA